MVCQKSFCLCAPIYSLISGCLVGVPREIGTKQFFSRKMKANCSRKHLLHFVRGYALGSFHKCCQENLNFEIFLLLNDLQISEKKRNLVSSFLAFRWLKKNIIFCFGLTLVYTSVEIVCS